MKPCPTYAIIAAACGVNVSTVSRALSGNPVISVATRKRIKAKAEAMGWRVNPFVSAYMAHLRSSRTIPFQANLAYVIPSETARTIDQLPGYHQEHYNGCRKHASGLGYGIEPIWPSEWGGRGEKLSKLLRSRGIPGAILHGISVEKGAYRLFDWASFAIAAWGSASPDYSLHRATANYHHDMQIALEKIKAYGYSHVALMFNENQDELSERSFYASFLYAKVFDKTGLEYSYFRMSDETPVDVVKRLGHEWVEKKKPDVIIGEQVFWEMLNANGWKIPEHVAFVSICYSPGWPQVSGVDQHAEEIGRNSVDLVVGQLVRNERGLPRTPKLLLSEGSWIDGASCPDRHAATRPRKRKQALAGV